MIWSRRVVHSHNNTLRMPYTVHGVADNVHDLGSACLQAQIEAEKTTAREKRARALTLQVRCAPSRGQLLE